MIRTQIQLPTLVYERARRVAKAKEISLAELARRGIESILDQYPAAEAIDPGWITPFVRSGGVKVPLERLKDFGEVDSAAMPLDATPLSVKPMKRKRGGA